MPSKSASQHRLMAAVAHNPDFAKKTGIPQSVGRDFTEADKGRKFAKGGDMKESKEMMQKEVAFMKKKKAPKSMIKHEMKEAKGYAKGGFTRAADGVAQKGKTKAQRFNAGGMPMIPTMQTLPSSVGRPVGRAGPQAMTPSRPNMPPAPAPYPRTGSGAVVTATPAVPRVPINPSDPSTLPAAPAPAPVAPAANTFKDFKPEAPAPYIAPDVKGYGTPGYGAPTPTNMSDPSTRPAAPAPAPQVGLPGKSVNAGPISGKPGMGQSTTSGARPTNPFTNPKQYQTEKQLDSLMAEKMKAKPGGPVMRGGRQATPEEIAKMNSTLSSLGMSRPQFNPADADKLRAQMQQRLAAQGMRSPAARPVMGTAPGMKSGGSVKTFAKGGSIDGCATKGKTKGRYI